MPVDRYGTVLAPGSLALVHSLLNTASVAPQYPDLLAVLSTAEAWVSAALPEWGHHKGVSVPDLNLVAKDLPRLRELRGAIGMMVGGAPAPGTGLVARLDIAVEAGARVAVHPRGRLASDWIRSAVLAERLTAQLTGIWPRLKVCANPACKVAFYDRSRNLSGTWHDVHICGNRINLRASRARRRDKGDNAAGVAPRE